MHIEPDLDDVAGDRAQAAPLPRHGRRAPARHAAARAGATAPPTAPRSATRSSDRPHRRAGHPAGLGRRLDLAAPQRAHPGASAPTPPADGSTSTTRSGGCQRDRGEVRPGAAGGRAAARRTPPGRAPTCSTGGLTRERVLAAARTAARPRLLPHRQRGVRRDQPHLRSGDAAARSTSTISPRRHPDLRLHRQARQAAGPDRRRRRRSATSSRPSSGGAAAVTSCSPTAAAKAPGSHLRSTEINDYLHGAVRHGVLGQGLPHLARHGPRRCRARRLAAGQHLAVHPQARGSPYGQGGLDLPRQHAGGLPGSYIDPRVIDRYDDGIHHRRRPRGSRARTPRSARWPPTARSSRRCCDLLTEPKAVRRKASHARAG